MRSALKLQIVTAKGFALLVLASLFVGVANACLLYLVAHAGQSDGPTLERGVIAFVAFLAISVGLRSCWRDRWFAVPRRSCSIYAAISFALCSSPTMRSSKNWTEPPSSRASHTTPTCWGCYGQTFINAAVAAITTLALLTYLAILAPLGLLAVLAFIAVGILSYALQSRNAGALLKRSAKYQDGMIGLVEDLLRSFKNFKLSGRLRNEVFLPPMMMTTSAASKPRPRDNRRCKAPPTPAPRCCSRSSEPSPFRSPRAELSPITHAPRSLSH